MVTVWRWPFRLHGGVGALKQSRAGAGIIDTRGVAGRTTRREGR